MGNGPNQNREVASPPLPARKAFLAEPADFLNWLWEAPRKQIHIEDFNLLQPWAIAALAAMSRQELSEAPALKFDSLDSVSRFAHSLGLRSIVQNEEPEGYHEPERTVKLKRFTDFETVDPLASEISSFIIPNSDIKTKSYIDAIETRKSIRYVMIELMRNVVQHSKDKLGGVIVAQSMYDEDKYSNDPCIQIAVADRGIGIHESISSMHEDVNSAEVALEKSILPYHSGAFPSWKRGSRQNAGLGLYFISEIVKLTGGRLLISSQGASLTIEGDAEGHRNNEIDFKSYTYDGTLVAFELPKRGLADHDAIIKTIQDNAKTMRADIDYEPHLSYGEAPPDTWEFMVNIGAENTSLAEEISSKRMIPRIEKGDSVSLNFSGIDVCTQSYLHALLFEPLQIAYKNNVDIFIKNAKDPVVEGLTFLEAYALSSPKS